MAPIAKRVQKTKRLAGGSTAPLLARNAARRAAVNARAGSFRCCPVCTAAVRVPDDATATSNIFCPVRKVRAHGQVHTCGFQTKPHCWRQRAEMPEERAAARVLAVRDSITHFAGRVHAGLDGNAGFWERVRDEATARVPVAGDVREDYRQHVQQPGDAAAAAAPAAAPGL